MVLGSGMLRIIRCWLATPTTLLLLVLTVDQAIKHSWVCLAFGAATIASGHADVRRARERGQLP